MPKKKLNSVLIILLLVIWGGVFYKYFGSKKSAMANSDAMGFVANDMKNYSIVKDTFVLNLNERDPFATSSYIKVRKPLNPKIAAKPKKNVTPIIPKNIVWPTITYHGFVKGESKTTRLILLKVGNRLYRKREKEIIDDIILVKAYNDSLIVSLNNTNKTIKRQ